MMKATFVVPPASAWASCGNGFFSRNVMRWSSGGDSSSVAAISDRPNPSRAPKRRMLATTSRLCTFSPSWKRKWSRNVNVQRLPLSSMV